ncbi:MAG: hypothetical protein CME62_15350 [Halobacteriovoraceae bacterium]|nr:hypothetical protein [Halobacteriovoraceae bacterium]|tara:strand:- start:17755 stop:18576 length:822 start_codon:yes stop_codon:yes gene_type:complete
MKSLLIFLLIFTNVYAAPFGLSDRYKVPQNQYVLRSLNANTHETQINPYQINVLVWNIYKGSEDTWEDSYHSLSYGQDIIITQEAFLTQKMKRVFGNSGFNYKMAVSFEDGNYDDAATGVATASQVKPLSTFWQRSLYREPITNTPKMTLFTTYALEKMKDKLLVGNIHGINFVSTYKLKHMLIKAAEVLARHKGPAIFAGDFNTWSTSKLKAMRQVLTQVGFKPVSFANDQRKRFLGKALDHVWIKDLKVRMSDAPEVEGSDHNPMLIELSI